MWTKETGKIVEIYKKSGKCKKGLFRRAWYRL